MLSFFMVRAKNLVTPAHFAQVSESQRNLCALSVSALDFNFPDFSISFTLRVFVEGPLVTRHLVFPESCFPVTPLEATLIGSSGSVHSKRLTETLSLLEATLTKTRGVVAPCSAAVAVSFAEAGRPGGAAVNAPLEPR